MKLRCSYDTIRQLHFGNAFPLSPSTLSVSLAEPREFANSSSGSERFNVRDFAVYLEEHFIGILQARLPVRAQSILSGKCAASGLWPQTYRKMLFAESLEKEGSTKVDNSVMSATALVSIESYLSAVYDPDVDYVDGALEDRHVGEKDHAKLQLKVARLLDSLGGFFVTIETRIRISDTRYRVPDICVYHEEPDEQVFTTPPLLVVEILTPEDRMSRMQEKMEDYYRMGCRDIWILDPARRKAYRYETPAMVEASDTLTVANDSRLSLRLSQIFG